MVGNQLPLPLTSLLIEKIADFETLVIIITMGRKHNFTTYEDLVIMKEYMVHGKNPAKIHQDLLNNKHIFINVEGEEKTITGKLSFCLKIWCQYINILNRNN